MVLLQKNNKQNSATHLFRYFTLAGFSIVLLAMISLVLLFGKITESKLIKAGEQNNIALATLLTRTLRESDYQQLLRSEDQLASQRRLDEKSMILVRTIQSLIARTPVIKVKIYAPSGITLFSTRPTEIGTSKSESPEFQDALQGKAVSRHAFRDEIYSHAEKLSNREVLSSYIPLMRDVEGKQKIVGVFEIYSDVSGLVGEIAQLKQAVLGDMALVLGISFAGILWLWLRVGRLLRIKEEEGRRNQEEIQRAGYFDPLTGLPNRRLFVDRLECAIARSNRTEKLLGVLFLDLDRFKQLNDSMGHKVGDQLLMVAAERLKSSVRAVDTVARQGGDEFTLLLEEVNHVDELMDIVERIQRNIQVPIALESIDVVMTCSIGVTIYPFDEHHSEQLLQNADAAMYQAKKQGRNHYVFYTAGMNHDNLGRLEMERGLRGALESNEYNYMLQAQVDLRTGKMCGAEVLLRWNHSALGMVSPVEFVPILEDCGLIWTVGEWVMRRSCEQYIRWQQQGMQPFKLSVNVSPVQFRHNRFVDMVSQVIEETGMDPRYLGIEITETMLIDNVDASITKLKQLKELGITIALDDFGTGYSSLSYLKKFPLDILKIDRSFVRDVHKGGDSAAIVTAIMALAHSLRLSVVAEGVEDARELAYLSALGCRVIQGYFFSRPVGVLEFEDILRDTDYFQRKFPAAS